MYCTTPGLESTDKRLMENLDLPRRRRRWRENAAGDDLGAVRATAGGAEGLAS